MFNSEREMQDTFVSLLKQRKTCGLIFEEVGNRNFFFRTDVVEYKDRLNIIGYELKLKDFHNLIEQTLYTINLYDKNYMVIPEDKLESLLKATKFCKDNRIKKVGIITVSKNGYKIVKQAIKDNTRDYNDKYNSTLVQDLIIRGYYKDGCNRMKKYI